jgi:phage gpG-like protein
MPDGMRIEVRGADRLARTSAEAADELRDLTEANRRAAEGIREATSPPRLSGRLAASLTVTASPTEGTVGSDLVYAPVIEFGWPAHGIEARRFLSNAADARWNETIDVYADYVDDALADVKGD